MSSRLLLVLASRSAGSPASPRRRLRSSSASATPASFSSRPTASGTLDARQQALAYWLTQASIAIDPIVYDQLSQYGIRQKRVIEEIMSHTRWHVQRPSLPKIRQYALLFWANRGNAQREHRRRNFCRRSRSRS